MLKREVQSVNYTTDGNGIEFTPPTPLSACSSFGDLIHDCEENIKNLFGNLIV